MNSLADSFERHTNLVQESLAMMYSYLEMLSAIYLWFLLIHNIIVDPKLKHTPEELFLYSTLPTQSASIYP